MMPALAQSETARDGNMQINATQAATRIIRSVGVNEEQLLRLLEPTNGVLPTTDAQLQDLMLRIRRMGHVLENSHNNIASRLNPRRDTRHYYIGESGDEQRHGNPWADQYTQRQPSWHGGTGGEGQPIYPTWRQAANNWNDEDYSDAGTDSETESDVDP